jgi:acetate CoA/acetoacetate CoA-transferase alpha subunit
MKSKIKNINEALSMVQDGDAVMIGGFLQCGNPQNLVKALIETKAKNLTVISNDTGTVETSSYDLIKGGQVTKILSSYIGSNPETGRLLNTGEAEVELFPQGTLAEKIRAGGVGTKGFLTEVGVGTIVEKGKQKMTVDGVECLLELPLRADISLIKADKADKSGNLVIKGSARNFNVLMAMAADYVVVEVREIVETGEIDPNDVTVPGIFIDAMVKI